MMINNNLYKLALAKRCSSAKANEETDIANQSLIIYGQSVKTDCK